MSSNLSDNLYLTLHRWASQQDENFVTDTFAHLLRHLQCSDPNAAATLICKLTNGFLRIKAGEESAVEILTQISTDYGCPDMSIRTPDHYVLVEVKVESEAGPNQLERYRKVLLESDVPNTCLVYLTRYPATFTEGMEKPDFQPRWFQVAAWIRNECESGTISSPVGRYLSDQFVSFLSSRNIAMRQVTSEVGPGIHSMRSLLLMVCEAITALGRKYTRPRALDYAGCYFDDKRYFVGIYFDRPEALVFNTEICHLNTETTLLEDIGGEIISSNWPGYSSKWRKEFDISPNNSGFYSMSESQQLNSITTFIRNCLRDIKPLEIEG